jgi:signal transduction histidine kinase
MGEDGSSQVLYTLERDEAVVVDDLGNEARFVPPRQLVEHGLVSGVSVVVTVRSRAHGVLSAYSVRGQRFSAHDVDFAQAVADLLGRAIERRDLEEAQERLHQQERLAAVGQLAAGVAHDFNNIVSAVSLYTGLLEGRQHLDDAGREHLAAIRQQVERATILVWQILDFAHRSPLQLVGVELSSFLAGLGPIMRRTMPDNVDITVVDQGGPYVVHGDPTRLQQIFLNLVTNARDASVGPGQLTITLSLTESPPDFEPLNGPDDRRWVRVDVADTGCGMPPGVLNRAFEPFFTTKLLAGGTGLGLSQVHGLVSQHGGHILIDSSVEGGTTVSIWLRRIDPVRTSPEAGSALR